MIRIFRAALLALAVSACAPLTDLDVGGPPLSIDAPIGPTTRGRLLRAVSEPAACRAWLADARVGFTPVADRTEGEACSVTGAGTLRSLGAPEARLAPARPMMTCELAAAMAVWRRQSLEPAAREILGAGVAQVDHLGVYACRRVNAAAEGRYSAHARAAAIDIAGVRLTDGRRISVARHWPAADTPEGAFLRRIRRDACRVFGVVLSPDYNGRHADHLHLEAEGGRTCA